MVPPPTLQAPLPSHVLANVTVGFVAFTGHEGGTHWVPAGYFRQTPLPSHVPSLPQIATSLMPHLPLGSFWPTATGAQVPGFVLNVHETHGPSHTLLQQTLVAPSEQTNPATHSLDI